MTKPIQQFIENLKRDDPHIKTGLMSSVISGDSQVVFVSLRKAFEKLAQRCEIVMTAKVSNACPEVNGNK